VIVVKPAATPVTRPDVPIVATAVLLLDHVPPAVVSNSVVVSARHTRGKSIIAPTLLALTVTVKAAIQPL